MNGSPSSVLTLGLGDWGSVGLLITIGFGIGAAAVTSPDRCEYTIAAQRMEYTMPAQRMEYTVTK